MVGQTGRDDRVEDRARQVRRHPLDNYIGVRYLADVSVSDAEYQRLAQLRFGLRQFLAFSEKQARAAGLNPQQHQLLLAIRGAPSDDPPTIGALAERMILRHHSVVELVDRLEKSGLVRRAQGTADKRQMRVVILPAGKKVLERLSLVHRAELRKAGPTLVATLRALLQPARSVSAPNKQHRVPTKGSARP